MIANDDKTNVYRANSLDNSSWDDDIHASLKPFLTRFPKTPKLDEGNQKQFKYFNFDLLLINPPFAGDVSEKHILRKFKLGEKNKKTLTKVNRDTLFLEQAFNLLKSGGRMAIILPQGKFNNSTEEHVRDFIMTHARIIAVIGLDALFPNYEFLPNSVIVKNI